MNQGHENQYNIFHPSDEGGGDNSTVGGTINQYDHLEIVEVFAKIPLSHVPCPPK